MDEFMKKYHEQMDKIKLSDAADQAILNELSKGYTQNKAPHRTWAKRNLSAAMVTLIILVASSVTVFAGVAIHGIIIQSNKAESQIDGIGAKVNVGHSYYFDLLAGNDGEIYALTDNDYNSELTDHHVIAWKSTDHGNSWETMLLQPEELMAGSSLRAGDLREREAGIEAIAIFSDEEKEHTGEYVVRVYQIGADSYKELDMEEVYTQFENQDNLFTVKYVNDNIIALAGPEKCLLYDLNSEKVVKNFPYDLTMGFLKTQRQFLIYGKEIYTCLNAETLEEQKPEEGLQEFVKKMFEKNNKEVMPPMAVWKDTIACATKAGIYEYKSGEITQIKQLFRVVHDGKSFNGMWPMCKTADDLYYICTLNGFNMSLWEIDGDKEELK